MFIVLHLLPTLVGATKLFEINNLGIAHPIFLHLQLHHERLTIDASNTIPMNSRERVL